MKPNYQAWNIDYQDFYNQQTNVDKLKFLLNFAVLAPSSHNSQPWRFEVGDNFIIIKPELKRALPVSDNNHRQLFISLGCALENILVAADYYGYKARADCLPDENTAARVSVEGLSSHSPDDEHLIFSIPKRHTDIFLYYKRQSQ